MNLFYQTLLLVFWVSTPILLIVLCSGVISGLLQGLTQIQDSSISAFIKLSTFALVLWFWGPRLFARVVYFANSLWNASL